MVLIFLLISTASCGAGRIGVATPIGPGQVAGFDLFYDSLEES